MQKSNLSFPLTQQSTQRIVSSLDWWSLLQSEIACYSSPQACFLSTQSLPNINIMMSHHSSANQQRLKFCFHFGCESINHPAQMVYRTESWWYHHPEPSQQVANMSIHIFYTYILIWKKTPSVFVSDFFYHPGWYFLDLSMSSGYRLV